MASKEEMFAKFQPWVLATYGDSAKTKTITVRKAMRIRALLLASDQGGEGGEASGSEAAKFRLWVKSKGLQLGKEVEGEEPALYIPTGTDKVRMESEDSCGYFKYFQSYQARVFPILQ